ncbi:MAG: hypothetical protein AVDCRST_MAG18-4336, partial [uncultured Thermomicrobiales bacterium]
ALVSRCRPAYSCPHLAIVHRTAARHPSRFRGGAGGGV